MIFWIHAVIIVAAHALDLWSTFVGIHHGARELNPTCEGWAHERRRMAGSKAVGAAFLVLMMWLIYHHYPHAFTPLIYLHHGFMYCVVLRNVWIVKSLKRHPYRYLYRQEVDGTDSYVGRCDLERGQACGPIIGVLREKQA